MEFVFSWCTDYQPDDGTRAKEDYVRRILERTARRVLHEDLESRTTGWLWKRYEVTLDPPGHWHAEPMGNHRDFSLDYRLRSLPERRTEFRSDGIRTAKPLGGPDPSKAAMHRELLQLWGNLGSALEAEHRAGRAARRAR
ncbi:MAG: hypothetical protein ACRECR_00400 [Thermoplasmata archaeon]